MFLDRLRASNLLTCSHPIESFDAVPSPFCSATNGEGLADECVRCLECQTIVLQSVRNYLCLAVSRTDSPTLAHEYAEWTGRLHVPCRFDKSHLRDRVLPEEAIARFSSLYRAYGLLRALHSPFVRVLEGGRPPTVRPKMFKNFLTDFLSVLDRTAETKCGEDLRRDPDNAEKHMQVVKTIFAQIRNAFVDVDIHSQYFEVFAPYVKAVSLRVRSAAATKVAAAATTATATTLPESAVGDGLDEDGYAWTEGEGEGRDRPFAFALQRELARSAWIHRHLSRFSVYFDVIHLMALTYLCGDDTDTVFNLVLDVSAKLCTGYFSFPISRTFETGIRIRRYLERKRSLTDKGRLYYFLDAFNQPGDELAEYLSESFIRKYGELECKIRNGLFGGQGGRTENKIENLVFQQTFPYVLFEDNGDDSAYFAFLAALSFYVSKTKFGSSASAAASSSSSSSKKSATAKKLGRRVGALTVPKGVVAECKRLYRFVREFIARVRAFEGSPLIDELPSACSSLDGVRKIYWTKDMFELFLTSNGNFGELMRELLVTFMSTV